jgi:microcystin-dependent protein
MARKRVDTAPQFNVGADSVLIQQVSGSTSTIFEVKNAAGASVMAIDSSGATTATFAAGVGLPVGMITPFAGATAPTGWFLCSGQAVSRTTYASLFAVISTTYGVGDGSTTFNLPDLRGRTVAGIDNMGGTDAGRLDIANSSGTVVGSQYVTLTSAQSGVPAHSHANTLGSNSVSTPGHQHAEHLMHGTTNGSAGMTPYAPWNDAVWGISPNLKTFANRQGFSMAGAEGSTVNGYPYLTSGELTAATTVTISNVNNTAANAASAHDNMQPTMVLNYIVRY